MGRAVIVTSDQKLAYQVETLMRELPDEVTLYKFTSVAEFAAGLESSFVDDEDKGEGGGDELLDAGDIGSGKSQDSGVDPFIRLVLVDHELLPKDPIQWIDSFRKELFRKSLSGPSDLARVVIMAFDDANFDELRHESVDDLILKPIDRTLFVQKVELLLADKPTAKPSFLYRQRTKETIEIGKDAVIEEISEFGVAVRNPVGLVEGLYAAIYCSEFGEKSESRVVGRVYQSVPHPTLEKMHLVRFSFFGLSGSQLAKIRKFVRIEQSRLARESSAETERRDLATNSRPVRPNEVRRVAVIDMNPFTFSEIRSALETNFRAVSVQYFPSYSRFMADLIRMASGGSIPGTSSDESSIPEGETEKTSKKPPAFPGDRKLTMILGGEFFEFVRFDPEPKNDEVVLGRTHEEWKERPPGFLDIVAADDKEEIEEFLSYVGSGAKGKIQFRMLDENRDVVYVEADGSVEKTGDADGHSLLRVEMKRLEKEKWNEQKGFRTDLDPSAMKFDAIYIDGAVIRSEPREWLDRLSELFLKARVLYPNDPMPKIFVMADETSRVKFESFRIKGIKGFFYKPLDRKHVVQKSHALVEELEWHQEPEVAHYVSCALTARLAKSVVMSEVSEYGLSILHPSPIKPGSYFHFYSPLLSEDSQGVVGRCSSSEIPKGSPEGSPGRTKETIYNCNFTFFAASDDFLKRIRKWIREDYVAKKDGAAS